LNVNLTEIRLCITTFLATLRTCLKLLPPIIVQDKYDAMVEILAVYKIINDDMGVHVFIEDLSELEATIRHAITVKPKVIPTGAARDMMLDAIIRVHSELTFGRQLIVQWNHSDGPFRELWATMYNNQTNIHQHDLSKYVVDLHKAIKLSCKRCDYFISKLNELDGLYVQFTNAYELYTIAIGRAEIWSTACNRWTYVTVNHLKVLVSVARESHENMYEMLRLFRDHLSPFSIPNPIFDNAVTAFVQSIRDDDEVALTTISNTCVTLMTSLMAADTAME